MSLRLMWPKVWQWSKLSSLFWLHMQNISWWEFCLHLCWIWGQTAEGYSHPATLAPYTNLNDIIANSTSFFPPFFPCPLRRHLSRLILFYRLNAPLHACLLCRVECKKTALFRRSAINPSKSPLLRDDWLPGVSGLFRFPNKLSYNIFFPQIRAFIIIILKINKKCIIPQQTAGSD